ncbi:MAG TPA: cation diffusion facilitator family transporter [Allosphingosinicella sp.]|nr:cation diffusion facilitator family transporter [Allosphingosinicella sp.]
MSGRLPAEIEADLRRAARLEWWTIGWMGSIIAVVGLAMGSSQAMRTAWVEDVLSLIPAIAFLVALHFERKGPNRRFPYGFERMNSLAFLVSAVALTLVGTVLLVEAAMTLVRRDHVTIPPVRIAGETVWLGWVMIAALLYSVVPPMILGRLKLPIARRLQDEVLHTDAMMQKADWMTGLAGAAGILGLGLGLWWADAAAAAIISFSILHDGVRALRIAAAELIDGAPRELESSRIAADAEALRERLEQIYPGADVRLRETGRFISAQVGGVAPPEGVDRAEIWPGRPEQSWRFAQLSFVPPDTGPLHK